MGFRCGIVGLPNVGKSTLFQALTASESSAVANYPFCTIEPHVGVVDVPDDRLRNIADLVKPQKVVPTTVQFVDIAGLVKGASRGEGLGNQFLANIRETQAILHVVRCFEDDDILRVDGEAVNPCLDAEIIDMELCLADQDTVKKAEQRFLKAAKAGDKAAKQAAEACAELFDHLNQGLPARTWLSLQFEGVQQALRPLCLLTAKPMLLVANVDDLAEEGHHLMALRDYAKARDLQVLPIAMKIESELLALDPQDRQDMLTEMGWQEPGLNRVIRAGYELLDLTTYFTAGVKEVRAWTVRRHATAPEAAGVIHSDFEKQFIRAEVVSYRDFIDFGGEQAAKDAGKWRLEGKDYILCDGDIIHFRTGA